MSNSKIDTASATGTGSGGKEAVEKTGGVRVFVAVIVAVILLLVAVWIGLSWRAAHPEKEVDQVAALRKLASAAASATKAAEKAISDKENTDKALHEKRQAEQAAEEKATTDEATAERLKREKSAGAAEGEKTAKDSRAAAGQRKTDRIDAEAAASKALVAVAAAKNPLQRSLVETVSAIFSWRIMEGIGLFLLLVGIFPLSAVAFMWLEVPSLMALLKNDHKMLGRPSTGTGDGTLISTRWDWKSYLLHCCLAVFATAAGAALFFRTADGLLDVNTLRGMQLGFLGAYVYCLHLIYRRYTTQDLGPHVYLSCAVGLIVGMVINYFAFAVLTSVATSAAEQPEFTGVGAGGASILAFSFGYFPNLAIRWFGRFSRTSVHERQRRSDALPLSLIDGISELHESRLLDEGIDNVQNLATVDIHDMVEKTPFTAQEIVEWVDQSILYLYVDPGEIDSFRKAGVRSVSDFRDIWNGFSVQYKQQSDGTIKQVPIEIGEDFKQRRKSIAQQLATTEERLDCLFRATAEGPNMELIQTYWSNCKKSALATRNVLINQVCGGIGHVLRESVRESETLTPEEILKQVAEQLFVDAPQTDEVSPESLCGQAFLKSSLGLYADARRLLEQCTKLTDRDPAAFNDLAWLDLQTGSKRSDFLRARTNAAKAVEIEEKSVAAANEAAKIAKTATPDTSDLPAYLDTLALAEIRLGNPDAGVTKVKEAIGKWDESGRDPQPRFLETVMSAAEAYLSKGNLAKAKEVLDFVDGKKYAKTTSKTKERIAQLRDKIPKAPGVPAPAAPVNDDLHHGD